jgi:predicted metal-dependent phosphotriesterase family hydrolase
VVLIRTVSGDLDPTSIRGAVAGFAHLEPDWRPLGERESERDLPTNARQIDAVDARGRTEHVVSSLRRRGVALIIDATPPGAGRDAMRLREVMSTTGVAIVTCTGAHAPPVRLARVEERSAEYLAEWFAFEIGSGVAPVTGDRFRGVPLLSEQANGTAGDGLNDAAVRAGAIRITLASALIDRADGALIDAAGMTASATGVATFLDTPATVDLAAVISQFEFAGGNRSHLVLAPRTRTPAAIVDAASLGMAVVVTAPLSRAQGALAIWGATIRELRRHGLLAQTIITTTTDPTVGMTPELLTGPNSANRQAEVTFSEACAEFAGADESELQALTSGNALRILGLAAVAR